MMPLGQLGCWAGDLNELLPYILGQMSFLAYDWNLLCSTPPRKSHRR